jgi:hypothetical protein
MRLARFFKRFHRDDRAQISFLAVAGVVCFVGLMSMVVNTDGLVSERIRAQNVSDATVLSAASWTARGLNMESYVNVLNTKLLSTVVLLNALKDALPVMQAVGEIQQAVFSACSGVPFVGVFCAVMATVVKIQLAVLKPLKNAVDKLADRLTKCGEGLWKLMSGLQKLGGAVQKLFPAIGIAESISIANANGMTGFVLNGKFTPKDQLQLPVKTTQFKDFCEPLKNGGPGYELQGYAVGQGPLELGSDRIKGTLLLPFINFFSWPIFSGMVKSHTIQVGCTPDAGDDSEVPVKLKDLEECKKYEATSRWAQIWSRTRPIEDGSLQLKDFVPWKPLNTQNDATDDEALDQGQIEGQLGQINLPDGPAGGAGGGDDAGAKPMGKAYQYLEKSSEIKYDLVEADCDGAGLPPYAPPFNGSWDVNQPGTTILCYLAMNQCRRIDEWNKFTWYNADHTPTETPKLIGGYYIRMTRQDADREKEGGPKRYVYAIETVSLVDAGTEKMSQEEFQQYLKDNKKDVSTQASNSTGQCEKPLPWMLDKTPDFPKRLQFIGIVWEGIEDHRLFWDTYFTKSPPRFIAYSQGQVYNYLSEDTFTQDWRVRLQPASLLSDFLKQDGAKASGLKGGAAGAIDAVNNH